MIVSVYLHTNIRGDRKLRKFKIQVGPISKQECIMALQNHPSSLVLAEIEYAYD